MEMGQNQLGDLAGLDSDRRQGTLEGSPAVATGLLDSKPVAERWILLVAKTGIDEDQAVAIEVPDQQKAHRQGNAMFLIGRNEFLPQDPRNGSEHRSAVEAKTAAWKGQHLPAAKLRPELLLLP